MEPEGSVPLSQQHATGPYPKQMNAVRILTYLYSLYVLILCFCLYLGFQTGFFFTLSDCNSLSTYCPCVQ
jgi:hypothetical protein